MSLNQRFCFISNDLWQFLRFFKQKIQALLVDEFLQKQEHSFAEKRRKRDKGMYAHFSQSH